MHRFAGNNHSHKEERPLPQHTHRGQQAHAQEGNKVRTVTGQGRTQGEPHESKGEKLNTRKS